MSATDIKMVPPDGDAVGGGMEEVQDRTGMEKVASSPDSAIDLTEDTKAEAEVKVEDMVADLLEEMLTEITRTRRGRKKKRARFTDSEKWDMLKDCSLVGWKRFLARNCEDGDGWGFNFVASNGVRLTARELEKFLKKRRLNMENLSFVAKGEGEKEPYNQYSSKVAKLKLAFPKHKIRDLKLSKAEELARRKLAAATRLAERVGDTPKFKSISEYLASLDEASQNSSCSDLSRLTPDLESEMDEVEEEEVEEDTEGHMICAQIVAECMADACAGNAAFSPQKDRRITTLEKSIRQVKQRLTGMLQPRESQDPVKEFKLNMKEMKERPIEKLIITPERLKHRSGSPSFRSKNSPNKLKIKMPKESPTPERIKLTIKNSKTMANNPVTVKIKKMKTEKQGQFSENMLHNALANIPSPSILDKAQHNGKPRKYSIFKTRNESQEQSPSLVKFRDKNAKKFLSVRKSLDEAPETPPSLSDSPEAPLRIVIDCDQDDGDLEDEFARTVKQESPRGKVSFTCIIKPSVFFLS